MNDQDFTTRFSVDQTPEEAFAAINNPRGWWSEEIEGNTNQLASEFTYRYKDAHRCRIKITEFEQRQLRAIREEIDKDFAERNAPATSTTVTAAPTRLSSNERT